MYDTVIITVKPSSVELPKLHDIDNLQFTELIVEQFGDGDFNRGKLINIGCLNYLNKTKYFIFRDISINLSTDTLRTPLAKGVDARKVGHTLKITHDAFFACNGYHNDLWHIGGEDEDFLNRLSLYQKNIEIIPTDLQYAREYLSDDHLPVMKFIKEFDNLTFEQKHQWVNQSGVSNTVYHIIDTCPSIRKITVII